VGREDMRMEKEGMVMKRRGWEDGRMGGWKM
jgi:hypothetical protein